MKYTLRERSIADGPSAKRAKNEEPAQRPIKYKSIEQKQHDKLEIEIKLLKEQNEKLQSENDHHKRLDDERVKRIEQLEIGLETLRKENCEIKSELFELEKEKQLENDQHKRLYDERAKQNQQLTIGLETLRKENCKIKSELSELKKEKQCLTSTMSIIEDEVSIVVEPTIVVEDVNEVSIVVESAIMVEDVNTSGEEANAMNLKSCFSGLKVNENDEYYDVEQKVKKDKEMEKELVKIFDENVFEETIKDFIIGSMQLIFTKNFFLKKTSFKHECGRVCVRDTKIFKCLMESINNKFGKDKIAELGNDLLTFIKDTNYDFKKSVRQSPHLWVDYNYTN